MCKLCTALLALSAAGLTIGGGLTMNPLVSGAVSGFAAGGIRGAVTGAFSAGVGAVAGQAIKEVPGFLSGVASDALRSTADSLLTSTEFNNITATIQSQGSSFFSNFDPAGGIAQKASEVFQSINAYATNAFTVAGSLSQLGDLKISEELGFNLTNPADLATGGLVREFGTLAGQAWTDITSGMQRFGTLFDPSNLGKAFNPLNVADNLIRQGFGEEILGALDSKGISYEQLMTGAVDPRAVTAALDAMPGNHLRQILESTGVQTIAGATIAKFSDALNIDKYLSEQARAVVPNLSALGNKLFNVAGFNGQFNNFQEWGQTLSQIGNPPTQYLNSLWNNETSWENAFPTQAFGKTIGTGVGVFGNPTITDFAGSASGHTVPQINEMTALQAQVMNTTEGQNLRNAILSAQGTSGDPTADAAAASAIQSALAPFINPTNSVLAQTVAAGATAFNTTYNQLVKERRNLGIAEINLSTAKATTSSVLAFTTDLHNVHNDEMYLGYQSFIEKTTTPDVYGEAIAASIVEGKNLSILRDRGIEVDTKFDPIAEARRRREAGLG